LSDEGGHLAELARDLGGIGDHGVSSGCRECRVVLRGVT
jgi:hypothetical protein